MRKVLIVALALTSLEAYFVAIAEAAGPDCEAIDTSCNNRCAAEPDTNHNCFSLCYDGYKLCKNFTSGKPPTSDDRTIKSNGGAANTKNIPGLGTTAGAGTNAGAAPATTNSGVINGGSGGSITSVNSATKTQGPGPVQPIQQQGLKRQN